MDYTKACEHLFNHAYFPGSEPREESFCYLLWKARRERVFPNLTPSVAAIMSSLEVVNRTANGPMPSQSVNGKQEAFDRRIVLAVASILHVGWQAIGDWRSNNTFPNESIAILERHLWRISCGWVAILDGDIDDLNEHAQLAEWARCGTSWENQRGSGLNGM